MINNNFLFGNIEDLELKSGFYKLVTMHGFWSFDQEYITYVPKNEVIWFFKQTNGNEYTKYYFLWGKKILTIPQKTKIDFAHVI